MEMNVQLTLKNHPDSIKDVCQIHKERVVRDRSRRLFGSCVSVERFGQSGSFGSRHQAQPVLVLAEAEVSAVRLQTI